MNANTIMEAYRELDGIIGKRETKKIQHNTYARREGADIVIRFHNTDILRYHEDGTVTLAAEGWHTTTTAQRFAEWLPRLWSVHNDRGYWNVFGPTNERTVHGKGKSWQYSSPKVAAHFRFWDGMRIVDEPRPLLVNYLESPDFTPADRLVRELKVLVDRYVAGYDVATLRELFEPNEDGSVSFAGDCFFCMGDFGADVSHLVSHLLEGYRMGSLVWNAFKRAKYGDPAFVLSINLPSGRSATSDERGTREIQRRIHKHLTDLLIPNGSGPAVSVETFKALQREVESQLVA